MSEASTATHQVQTDDPLLAAFVTRLRARFGTHVQAVLLYGSYVRGKRDTVLDFYVLLDNYAALPRWHAWANRVLPPNVYYLTVTHDAAEIAAKFATVSVAQFANAISGDVHSYFWARFAQPFIIAYALDDALREHLLTLGQQAAKRMIAATLPLLPPVFSTEELWRRAFGLTYGSELRAEDAAAGQALYSAYASALDRVTVAHAVELGLTRDASGAWQWRAQRAARRQAEITWYWRRLLGKALSIARLLKAAFTFNDPLDYVVWKVARHSGVIVTPSARARRHPLVFGWGVLWRLYRAGGFR